RYTDLCTMNAPRKYAVKQHKPSDLGGQRAMALFEFRDAEDDPDRSLLGDWPDTKVKGLYLHIGKRGATWRFKAHVQRNKKRRTHFQTLGTIADGMDFVAARRAATVFAGTIAAGKARPGRRAARRFGEAFADYLQHLLDVADGKNKLPRWHDNARK